MKKSKHLMFIFFVTILMCIPNVKASVGELRYQITGFSINDNDKTITFKGWAFIHKTNNYNTIYKLVNGNDSNSSDIVVRDGGQKIKISAYDSMGNIIASKSEAGNSKENYNFTKRMYYLYDNTYEHFITDYNQENVTKGNMKCDSNDTNSNCYYKDLYFEIQFKIDDKWYGKDIHFTIAATNDDYKNKKNREWTEEEKLHILSSKYGGPKINSNSQILKVKENTTVNKVKFLAETALVRNFNWSELLGEYGHPGDIFLVKEYDESGESGIGGTKGVGRYFLYSNGEKPCNIPDDPIWAGKNCWYGSESETKNIIGAWNPWVIPYGDTSFTIGVKENEKKCPIDAEKTTPLSCNNTKNLVSECNELTVTSGNESTTVSVKQTGILANLLSPTEIYNGGGIKFGLIYYNRVEFNYVSGSHNIALSDVMNGRITNDENISLENVKIGNINVDSSYIKKECNQIKGNNYVDTICLFHFKPQIVNEDGTITKDDVDLKYDQGINNKYYLPLDYTPVYRVSASLMNASILSKEQAKKDGENNKVWYGNKWDEIKLSNDGSCDINVYKLGPGSNNGSDSNEDGGQTPSKIIYKFIYRPIDLNNPFPGRIPGLNWYNWYNNNPDKLKEAYNSLQYNIELNNIIINKIKNYNSSKNYFNFDYDNFINETGLKVGGNE